MIKVHVQGRGTGKSTKVTALLENLSDTILIVPTDQIKREHEAKNDSLKHRIFGAQQFLDGRADGVKYTTVIVDDGMIMRDEVMIELYYTLGLQEVDVIVYGTRKGE